MRYYRAYETGRVNSPNEFIYIKKINSEKFIITWPNTGVSYETPWLDDIAAMFDVVNMEEISRSEYEEAVFLIML